jgi:hypothetical protein
MRLMPQNTEGVIMNGKYRQSDGFQRKYFRIIGFMVVLRLLCIGNRDF